VAAVLSKFGSGSKGAISGLRNHVRFALDRGNPEHQVECLGRVKKADLSNALSLGQLYPQ
jgi:hypothetical protein